MTVSKTNTRRNRRVRASGPATIKHKELTLAATVRDVSLGGVFLFTDARFQPGADIDIVLMLPQEIGLPSSQMVCAHGKIVRVEDRNGEYGLAAEIERIQGMPQL